MIKKGLSFWRIDVNVAVDWQCPTIGFEISKVCQSIGFELNLLFVWFDIYVKYGKNKVEIMDDTRLDGLLHTVASADSACGKGYEEVENAVIEITTSFRELREELEEAYRERDRAIKDISKAHRLAGQRLDQVRKLGQIIREKNYV